MGKIFQILENKLGMSAISTQHSQWTQLWSLFNITQKLIKEHSEGILIVECLEYSSPSWTRSHLAIDKAVMWAKAKVCVHADSVPYVGQVKDISGHVEGLRLYSSYQDAVGIDGEPTEFEWKISQVFCHYLFFARSRTTWRQRTSSQETSLTASSSCQIFTTFEWKRNDEYCI